MQLKQTGAENSNTHGIILTGTSDTINFQVSNCILQGTTSAYWGNYGIYLSGAGTTKIFNNIVYNFRGTGSNPDVGILVVDTNITAYIYNNTVYNNGSGGINRNSGTCIAKNNLSYNNSNDYIGTFDSSSTNNLSKDATAPAFNTYYRSATVNFVSTTAGLEDFHLSPTDTGAKGLGTSLASDSALAFSNDIDSQERTGNWTIGADEPVEATIQSSDQKAQSLTDGLVLYQSFDGEHLDWSNTSAEARDQSGSENHGDVSGATSAIGKKGQALSFDGTDDYVNTNSVASLVDKNQGSFSAWIYANSYGASDVSADGIIEVGSSSSSANGITLSPSGLANVDIKYRKDSVTTRTSITNAPLRSWYHVVGTWTASTLAIYLNGQLAQSVGNGPVIVVALDQSRIGSDALGTQGQDSFDGKIDEVRIYNRALSSDEVGNLYHLGGIKTSMSLTDKNTNGLVGMWSFDGADIAGTTAYDRSPVGTNHGTITGAIPVLGKKGQALKFDGNGDYVTTTFTSQLNDFTVSFWFKDDGTAASYERLVDKYYVGGFWLGRNGTTANSWGGGILESGSPYGIFGTFPDGQWNYMTSIRRGTTHELYVNGVFATSNTVSATALDTTALQIGNGTTSQYGGVTIDEVRVYNRALSADEVGDLYRLGTVTVKR